VLERLSNRSRTRSAYVVVVKAVQWERREREREGDEIQTHSRCGVADFKDRERVYGVKGLTVTI
jgi:hypothetical protein